MVKGSKFLKLCDRLGYSFQQAYLLEIALRHRSVGLPNNERLEFLGDAVLNLVISDALLKQFPEKWEGQLSPLRATLVKGECLAAIAFELDLGAYMILGPGELRSGGHRRASILADGLEALFGAIYLDGGYAAAAEVILGLYQDRLEQAGLTGASVDSKTRLQESLQAEKKPLPQYGLTRVTGEDHDQIFHVDCRVLGMRIIGQGSGVNRRKAEQAAASDFLEKWSRANI